MSILRSLINQPILLGAVLLGGFGAWLAYDAVRHVVVLFGGWTCCAYGGDFSDTWEWDGLNWTQVGSGT